MKYSLDELGEYEKALLGADVVSVGRPFIVVVHAAGEEGMVNLAEAFGIRYVYE